MPKIDSITDEDSEFSSLLEQITLDRTTPLRNQVYLAIRKAIIGGKLTPNTPIHELAVAEKLKISRTPVREAVKKLSDEGLITVLSQNGTYVSEIRREQIEEAYIIRIALEVENVTRAANVITKSQVYDLEDIIDTQRAAIRRERFGQAIEADDRFHKYITDINNFHTLWRIVDMTKAQLDRCRVGSINYSGAGQQTVLEHTEIVAALEANDPKAARKAMLNHLNASRETTLNYIDNLTAKSSNSKA